MSTNLLMPQVDSPDQHDQARGTRALSLLLDLVNLVGRGVRDRKAREALSRVRSTVGYLTHILDVSSRFDAPEPFQLARQIEALCQELAFSISAVINPESIRFHVATDPLVWNPERMLRLLVIVHELVSNSLRHGVGRDGGNVCVQIYRDGDFVCVSVDDDGPGLAPDAFIRDGFGIPFVETLVRDSGGDMSFRDGPACHIMIRLPA